MYGSTVRAYPRTPIYTYVCNRMHLGMCTYICIYTSYIWCIYRTCFRLSRNPNKKWQDFRGRSSFEHLQLTSSCELFCPIPETCNHPSEWEWGHSHPARPKHILKSFKPAMGIDRLGSLNTTLAPQRCLLRSLRQKVFQEGRQLFGGRRIDEAGAQIILARIWAVNHHHHHHHQKMPVNRTNSPQSSSLESTNPCTVFHFCCSSDVFPPNFPTLSPCLRSHPRLPQMLLRPKVFRGNFEVCIACHQRKGVLSVERLPWKICTSGSDFPCGKCIFTEKAREGPHCVSNDWVHQVHHFIFQVSSGGMPNSKVASLAAQFQPSKQPPEPYGTPFAPAFRPAPAHPGTSQKSCLWTETLTSETPGNHRIFLKPSPHYLQSHHLRNHHLRNLHNLRNLPRKPEPPMTP